MQGWLAQAKTKEAWRDIPCVGLCMKKGVELAVEELKRCVIWLVSAGQGSMVHAVKSLVRAGRRTCS